MRRADCGFQRLPLIKKDDFSKWPPPLHAGAAGAIVTCGASVRGYLITKFGDLPKRVLAVLPGRECASGC